MKFFLFFLVVCFFGGLLLHKRSPGQMAWLLAGFGLLVMAGYFFLNQI